MVNPAQRHPDAISVCKRTPDLSRNSRNCCIFCKLKSQGAVRMEAEEALRRSDVAQGTAQCSFSVEVLDNVALANGIHQSGAAC